MKTLTAEEYQAKYGGTPAAPAPSPSFPSRVADAFERRTNAAADEIVSNQPFERKALRTLGEAAGFVANDIPGAAIASIPEPVRQLAAEEVKAALNFIPTPIRNAAQFAAPVLKVQADIAMKSYDGFKQKHPEAAKDIEAIFNISQIVPLERMLSLVGRGAAGMAKSVADQATETVGSLFKRPANSVEDAVMQADIAISRAETPGATRAAAEATAPKLSVQERWVGISPDIKARIAGKQEKLQEYFDVAHARNNSDLAPTPYEYGAAQADKAVQQMETLLNETGGKIGQTRQKLGTYNASFDDIARIENSFTSQLDRLNLEVRNGVIRQKPGTVSKVGSGDIKVLGGLYSDLLTVKQSPTLTNLIDLRDAFGSKINFAKQAREASNEIDPLSRQLRKEIADTAATIVGPTEAAEVKRFSDFMEAYKDLKSYTDRKAGGEYLLRLVLSGRGGEAREIIQTIKDYTGIDLMDDATMMTIATDVIGNSRQQGLFRQEITKAGLDAASIMRGDAGGAMRLAWDLISKRLVDAEKTFLEAAQ